MNTRAPTHTCMSCSQEKQSMNWLRTPKGSYVCQNCIRPTLSRLIDSSYEQPDISSYEQPDISSYEHKLKEKDELILKLKQIGKQYKDAYIQLKAEQE